MLKPRQSTHFAARFAATAAAALFAIALSPAARGDGTTQPDPPVPVEAVPGTSSSPTAIAAAPDCRCGALYARDLAGRIDGHVERWEALPRPPVPAQPDAAMAAQPGAASGAAVHVAFVDGVVGFPLHDFRLSE
jgi:hypothetical protein